MSQKIEDFWQQEELFNKSFEEYSECVRDVLAKADDILRTPQQTPAEFQVRLAPIPPETYAVGRNLFSTLFQSVYHLLKISPPRRLLYGKLNHLFRVWVTSADNLLDDEDKGVIPIQMAGSSRVMRQVISIMLADRILSSLIAHAIQNGTLTEKQGQALVEKSLQLLLPSAAEEASEENGITVRPDADYVLNTIHRLKTGLLFHIPFLGPDYIEEGLDSKVLALCKDGLMSFGIGCQILDDIRDLSRDYLEARHNYILSDIFAEHPVYVDKLNQITPVIDVSSNIFELFPDAVHPAAEKAAGLLTCGLESLTSAGLGVNKAAAAVLSMTMFETLGVGELVTCLTVL